MGRSPELAGDQRGSDVETLHCSTAGECQVRQKWLRMHRSFAATLALHRLGPVQLDVHHLLRGERSSRRARRGRCRSVARATSSWRMRLKRFSCRQCYTLPSGICLRGPSPKFTCDQRCASLKTRYLRTTMRCIGSSQSMPSRVIVFSESLTNAEVRERSAISFAARDGNHSSSSSSSSTSGDPVGVRR